MQRIIVETGEKIAELCRTRQLRRLSIFGSAVRDDIDPVTCAVDLLVEFEDLTYPESVEDPWSEIRADEETLYAA